MILRYFAMIGLIFCASCPQTTRAEPPSCDERLHYLEWTQKYFDSADAVFLGIVVEETPDLRAPPAQPGSDPPNTNSMAELLELVQATQSRGPSPERLQTATFAVDRSWKGLVGPTITAKANLYVDDTGHHPLLRKGESYLVFAYKSDDDKTLRIPVGCASHQSKKETNSKIRVLDALTKKPGDR